MRQRFLHATDESIDFLVAVRDGLELEQVVTLKGDVVSVKPKLRDRIAAARALMMGSTLALAPEKPEATRAREVTVLVRHEWQS